MQVLRKVAYEDIQMRFDKTGNCVLISIIDLCI